MVITNFSLSCVQFIYSYLSVYVGNYIVENFILHELSMEVVNNSQKQKETDKSCTTVLT